MSDQHDETAGKTPTEQVVEHALDVFVYAPIGLLFEGATLLPQLVEKGRSQVTMARMVGQFAVTQGRSESEKLTGRLQDQALGLLARFGQSPSAHPGADYSAPAAAPVAAVAPAPVEPAAAPAPAAPAAPAIDPATLAIPDYDGLSASHVVNRLAGLSGAELEAVRQYELANRGRKTILSKVAQLQAG